MPKGTKLPYRHCPVMAVRYYDYIDNASGFIMKDFRKFSGSNKSPARFMAGSRVLGKK